MTDTPLDKLIPNTSRTPLSFKSDTKTFKKSKRNKYNFQEENDNIINNNNYETEGTYDDEYQGLMYYPRNDLENIIYYMEKEQKEEYNNFKTKWKTEICRYWEMYGECKYGDSCAFAHGDSELKKRKMTFNYKTKPCKQFFELGYCSYGSRCQFSHKKQNFEEKNNKNNEVSYLKIIKEFLSSENEISHELVKRPRLITFEKITKCTKEESQKSKLKLYEDIINLKNTKFKLSEDTNYSNISNDNNNNKN